MSRQSECNATQGVIFENKADSAEGLVSALGLATEGASSGQPLTDLQQFFRLDLESLEDMQRAVQMGQVR